MYTLYTILALFTALGLYWDVVYCCSNGFDHILVRIARGIMIGGMYGAIFGCLAAQGIGYVLPTHVVTSEPIALVSMTPVDRSHPFRLSSTTWRSMTVMTACGHNAACAADVPVTALVIVAPDPSLAPDVAFWTKSDLAFDVSPAVRHWAMDIFGSFEHPVVEYFRVPVGARAGS